MMRRIIYLLMIILVVSAPLFCAIPFEEKIKSLIESLSSENVFEQQKGVKTLVGFGKESVPQLIKAIDSENRDTSANAIEALGFIGDETAISHIIRKLKKHSNIRGFEVLGDQYIRVNSIKALGRLGAKEAIPVLEEVMQNERKIDMAWCLTALYEIDSSESRLKPLFENAKSEDPNVRNVILCFLSGKNAPGSLPVLKDALVDKEWYVRDTAVKGIGLIGGKEQIRWLEPLLGDPVPFVVETARSTIEKLKNKS